MRRAKADLLDEWVVWVVKALADEAVRAKMIAVVNFIVWFTLDVVDVWWVLLFRVARIVSFSFDIQQEQFANASQRRLTQPSAIVIRVLLSSPY
jgi:hypothetical protein